MDAYSAALMRERAFYLQQDRPDRVAGVEAELTRVGIDPASLIADRGMSSVETAIAPPAPERAVPGNERSAGNGR